MVVPGAHRPRGGGAAGPIRPCPQSKQNYFTKSQFIDEFNEYLEGLAASSGRLLICGDFNINWLDTSDNICKKLLNTLVSYNLHACHELHT